MSARIFAMNLLSQMTRRSGRALSKYSISVSFLLLCFAPSLFSVDFINNDFDMALTESKIVEKPLMVFFYTEWCGWCKAMDEMIFSNPEMSDYSSKELVSVRIDAEKGNGLSLIKKYKVRSYPTVVFLNNRGKEINRINGFLMPKSFLKMTKTVVEIFNTTK